MDRKREIYFVIIIILLLLIFRYSFSSFINTTNNNSGRIPVDTIEVDGKDNNKNNDKNKEEKSDSVEKTIIEENNVAVSEEVQIINVEPSTGKLYIGDGEQEWSTESSLRIFNTPSISPGDNGSYYFEVRNNTNKLIKYVLAFDEVNEYHVNLLYKLKRNGEYIAGSQNTYISFSNLEIPFKELNNGEKDTFTIDWKWVDASNDSEIGLKAAQEKVTYTIKAQVTSYELVE